LDGKHKIDKMAPKEEHHSSRERFKPLACAR
jgi:hypothetical protein